MSTIFRCNRAKLVVPKENFPSLQSGHKFKNQKLEAFVAVLVVSRKKYFVHLNVVIIKLSTWWLVRASSEMLLRTFSLIRNAFAPL